MRSPKVLLCLLPSLSRTAPAPASDDLCPRPAKKDGSAGHLGRIRSISCAALADGLATREQE